MTEPDVQPDLSACGFCGKTAQFTEADPGANPVSYCSECLPEHLKSRAMAGQLPLQSGQTKAELLEEAQTRDIEGRSSMTKTELENAVAADVASDLNFAETELSAPAEVLAHDEDAPAEARLLADTESAEPTPEQSDAPPPPAPAARKGTRKK